MGLWIHEPRPDARKRLFDASSHASTSGVMVSLYSALLNLSASRISFELYVIVLPSLATSEPPNDHMMARQDARESSWWARPIPMGKPLALSFIPPLCRSSQVSGPLGMPTSVHRSLR